jgi:hypothetical protein
MTYTIQAGRVIGSDDPQAGLDGALGALVGLAWAVFGIALWSVLEHRARKTGTIESMSLG